MDIIDNEKPNEEKESTPVREYNVVEEMMKLEQQMKDPNFQTFKKTTYWNQQNNSGNSAKSDSLLIDTRDCLLRIENILSNIEILLKDII